MTLVRGKIPLLWLLPQPSPTLHWIQSSLPVPLQVRIALCGTVFVFFSKKGNCMAMQCAAMPNNDPSTSSWMGLSFCLSLPLLNLRPAPWKQGKGRGQWGRRGNARDCSSLLHAPPTLFSFSFWNPRSTRQWWKSKRTSCSTTGQGSGIWHATPSTKESWAKSAVSSNFSF